MSDTAKPRDYRDVLPRDFRNLTPKEYIDERLNSYKKWYDSKAVAAKKNYLMTRTVTVVAGVILPVVVNIKPIPTPYTEYAATLISLLVALLVSLETVFHYREQWKNYRSTEQFLGREYFLFVSGEGVYKQLNEAQAFVTFVERIESAIAAENASTLEVLTTVSESQKEKPSTERSANKKTS
jgi:hypothetical protein